MSDRAIRLEVEVPGIPEQVWEAIATGAGIAAWFVPADVAEREGGHVRLDFGEGFGEESGTITAWEPPRRFVYESPDEADRRLAYEWLVEARSGDTCVVRLVNSGFGTGEDWDDQYDGMTGGWRMFLDGLRLYLTHFAGQPCVPVIVNGSAPGPHAEAWRAMTGSLGVPETVPEGEALATTAPAPRLAGTVQRSPGWMHQLVLDEPAPGHGFVSAEPFAGTNHMAVYLYLTGDDAAAIADRERPAWRAWMQESFPAAKTPAGAA